MRPGLDTSASERAAFASFLAAFPDRPTLLVDTYDTLRGARLEGRNVVVPRGDRNHAAESLRSVGVQTYDRAVPL